MKKVFLYTALIIALAPALVIPLNAEMSSDSYRIPTSTISSGGTPISSDSYDMNSTIGQASPLIDSGSSNYDLYPGFWYTLDVILGGCWWDIEPESGDGDVDGSDLAEFADNFIESQLAAFAAEFGSTDC